MSWFVAVVLPPAIAAEVADTVRGCADHRRFDVESADRLHVTVCFYGNVTSAALPILECGIADVAAASRPFSLAVGRGGTFPGSRVVWAGVSGDVDVLGGLRDALHAATARHGSVSRSEVASSDRPYSPHVTVARWRDRRLDPAQLVDHLDRSVHTVSFRVDSLALLSSHAGRYTVQAVFPLGQGTRAPVVPPPAARD